MLNQGLTSNAVKALGRRLRDDEATDADWELLEQYKAEHDELLLVTAATVSETLHSRGVKHVLAGRTKRNKSIVRKLLRGRHHGMDLSRMDDVVGLRVIVRDRESQDKAVEALASTLHTLRLPSDYRTRETGYRAVHLVVGEPSHRIEIQVRTCAQHHWADRSERLGEHAKEGILTPEQETYLTELGAFTTAMDNGTPRVRLSGGESELGAEYAALLRLFDRTVRTSAQDGGSFVVVYDGSTNTLVRVDAFGQAERTAAIKWYRYQAKNRDDMRFDVLVLNSESQLAMAVTHPRYFPESSAA
jgi:putative GTP pyrophosphokinase